MAGFDEFYRDARNPCYRAVLASIGDPDASAEVLAEAMARALARWDRLEHHPNPEAWVVLTAVNVYRSWWRRWKRSLRLGQDSNRYAEVAEPLDETLLEALRGLSVRQREVVALRVLLDLDTAATAAQLGIAPGTVTAHLHRALSQLRLTLTPQEREESHGPR